VYGAKSERGVFLGTPEEVVLFRIELSFPREVEKRKLLRGGKRLGVGLVKILRRSNGGGNESKD